MSHDLIISIHIPKTGGTSLIQTAKQVYKDACLRLTGTPSLEDAYKELCKNGLYTTKFIHGHIPYGLHEFLPEDIVYKYITFLRNPYDRILSLYNFYFYTKRTDKKTPPIFDVSFQDWINMDGTASVENDMTRILGNTPKKLLNKINEKDRVSSQDYTNALQNLKLFYFIGLTETYSTSLNILANYLGWSFIPYQEKVYYFPNRRGILDCTEKELSILKKTQKYDILLYNRVQKLVGKYNSALIKTLEIRNLGQSKTKRRSSYHNFPRFVSGNLDSRKYHAT